MANDIRALVPLLKHAEAIEDLDLLVAYYNKLTEYLDAGHGAIEPHLPRAGPRQL